MGSKWGGNFFNDFLHGSLWGVDFCFPVLGEKVAEMFSGSSLVCVSQCGFAGLALQQKWGNPCSSSLCLLLGHSLGRTEGSDVKERPSPIQASASFTGCLIKFWALLFIPPCSELAGIEFSCCQGGEVVCLPPSEKIELCLHGRGASSCLCLLKSTEHRVVLLYL